VQQHRRRVRLNQRVRLRGQQVHTAGVTAVVAVVAVRGLIVCIQRLLLLLLRVRLLLRPPWMGISGQFWLNRVRRPWQNTAPNNSDLGVQDSAAIRRGLHQGIVARLLWGSNVRISSECSRARSRNVLRILIDDALR
jgi:hypothetical protein